MRVIIDSSVIELVQGDITGQATDAIVNAANRSLLGGGGVDGAIHRVGGPAILEECRKLGGCKTGEAKVTGGGNLGARFVIHAVGPVWRGGHSDEEQLLKNVYRNSLERAREVNAKTVSFPSISTGAYSYPVHQAAHTALKEVKDFLSSHQSIELVRFVLFDCDTYGAYERALNELVS